MGSNKFGVLACAAVIGCMLISGASTARAQRQSSPLRIGGGVSPDRRVQKEKREREEEARRERTTPTGGIEPLIAIEGTTRGTADQFQEYPGIAQALGVSVADLKAEYEAEHKKVPRLQPKHLFGAKLLAQTAEAAHPGAKISDKDIIKSLAKGVSPLQFLLKKGFKDAEAVTAFDAAMRKLEAAKKPVGQ